MFITWERFWIIPCEAGKSGSTRIPGIVHLGWVPLFIWMETSVDVIATGHVLTSWLVILILTLLVSLFIDSIAVTRYANAKLIIAGIKMPG